MRFFEILFEDIWSDIATKWSDKENIPLDQVELYINKYKQLKQKNMFDNPEHKDIQHIYKNMDFLQFKQLVDQTEIKANQTKGAIRSKIKNSADMIVYRDDSDWLIVVPKNKETSQNIGTETTWCTASRGDNYFDRYTINAKGTMVYLINKHEEQKLSNNKSKYAIRFSDKTGKIEELENAPQSPHNLPEQRFAEETGFNPHEIIALIRNSKEWKDYSLNKISMSDFLTMIQNGDVESVKRTITKYPNFINLNDGVGYKSPLETAIYNITESSDDMFLILLKNSRARIRDLEKIFFISCKHSFVNTFNYCLASDFLSYDVMLEGLKIACIYKNTSFAKQIYGNALTSDTDSLKNKAIISVVNGSVQSGDLEMIKFAYSLGITDNELINRINTDSIVNLLDSQNCMKVLENLFDIGYYDTSLAKDLLEVDTDEDNLCHTNLNNALLFICEYAKSNNLDLEFDKRSLFFAVQEFLSFRVVQTISEYFHIPHDVLAIGIAIEEWKSGSSGYLDDIKQYFKINDYVNSVFTDEDTSIDDFCNSVFYYKDYWVYDDSDDMNIIYEGDVIKEWYINNFDKDMIDNIIRLGTGNEILEAYYEKTDVLSEYIELPIEDYCDYEYNGKTFSSYEEVHNEWERDEPYMDDYEDSDEYNNARDEWESNKPDVDSGVLRDEDYNDAVGYELRELMRDFDYKELGEETASMFIRMKKGLKLFVDETMHHEKTLPELFHTIVNL